jgi:hypothetical protein
MTMAAPISRVLVFGVLSPPGGFHVRSGILVTASDKDDAGYKHEGRRYWLHMKAPSLPLCFDRTL